jgi:RHS repeat-associated protein
VTNPAYGEEYEKQYYYHGDHLGSAQLVTDSRGRLYEHVEYTPYGELWVDHQTELVRDNPTVFRFTGKELDAETGLYYYGARYLDPKTSRWLSGDPAMGEYIPQAPVSDQAKKYNQNLPGMGGIFNLVNLHVYHYAGNNPVKLVDPDGRKINWDREEGVTDEQYERVQRAAERLENSDTEAGKRYRDLRDDPDVTVNIKVIATPHPKYGPAWTEPYSTVSAGDGLGCGSDVFITAKTPLLNPEKTLGVRLAHEVSGHAYDNHNGTNKKVKKNSGFLGDVASERYAVAMENEYRSHLGLSQRKYYDYTYPFTSREPMPLYDKKAGSWYIKSIRSGKRFEYRM